MAQTNYTPIQLYYSTTASAAPVAGNLASGELAINITDGILFYKDNGGIVQTLATKAGTSGSFTTLSASSTVTLSGGTANGVAYLNGSKVVTTGSALQFDGTTLSVGTVAAIQIASANYVGAPSFGVRYNASNARLGINVANANGFPYIGYNANNKNGSDTPTYDLTQAATQLRMDGGAFKFNIAGSGTAGSDITFTQAMTLDASGYLGVGNTSPSSYNAAAKNLVIGSGGSSGITVVSGTSGDGSLHFADGTSGSEAYRGQIYYNHAADFMVFGTAGAERARIDSSGNFGLGVTPSAFNSVVKALQINNGTFQGSTNNSQFTLNAYFNGTNYTRIDTARGAMQYIQDQGAGHSWGIASSGASAFTFTQAMTLDASGLVQIGTTSNTGGARLDVVSNATSAITTRSSSSGVGQTVKSIRAVDSSASNFAISQYDGLSHAWILSGGTQAMTLDASGNLGIGLTSPMNTRLAIQANTTGYAAGIVNDATLNYSQLYFYSTTSAAYTYIRADGRTTGYLAFGTNDLERARIDSSGNLLVGTTSVLLAGKVSSVAGASANGGSFQTTAAANNYTAIAGARNGNNGNVAEWWYNTSTQVGTIAVTGSTTAYNTSSDYRLKRDVTPMIGALAKVVALKPCTYKWNSDGSDGEGFIAHELAEVCPHAVTGEKDAVDENGNPKYQGIDTSFLVATLTAAIQEMKSIIDDQAARIAVLEAK